MVFLTLLSIQSCDVIQGAAAVASLVVRERATRGIAYLVGHGEGTGMVREEKNHVWGQEERWMETHKGVGTEASLVGSGSDWGQ